jgi:hypothetical protein
VLNNIPGQNIKRRIADLKQRASASSHYETQPHTQAKQAKRRARENRKTRHTLSTEANISCSHRLSSSDVVQCTPLTLSADGSFPPDGFYEDVSPSTIWLPFASLDKEIFRPHLESQSSPATSTTGTSKTSQDQTESHCTEAIWRNSLGYFADSYDTFSSNYNED